MVEPILTDYQIKTLDPQPTVAVRIRVPIDDVDLAAMFDPSPSVSGSAQRWSCAWQVSRVRPRKRTSRLGSRLVTSRRISPIRRMAETRSSLGAPRRSEGGRHPSR